MRNALLFVAGGALAILAAAAIGSCSAVKTATEIAAGEGLITEEQKGSIDRTNEAFRRSQEDLTEEEEYYIGRAVAADLIARYGLHDDPALTAYLNRVGKAVSVFSTRPEIFAGYHVAVLATDEVNAFATPGGFIFVTRGILRLVPDEEALAAVLAHEVAHVANRHGLQAINKNRLLEAFSVLGNEASRTLDQNEIAKLTEIYDGAVGDVVKTLVETGYSREQESVADRQAVEFAAGVGYQPDAMLGFLDRMGSAETAEPLGMFLTHPPAAERKAGLQPVVGSLAGQGTDPEARRSRFRESLSKL